VKSTNQGNVLLQVTEVSLVVVKYNNPLLPDKLIPVPQ